MRSCTFVGHRNCSEKDVPDLEKIIKSLIVDKAVENFYVGYNGGFDSCVIHTLRKLKIVYNIRINIVITRLNVKTKLDSNETVFPEELTRVPQKFRINKRNEYMIKNSEFLISYVNNTQTNSYKFLNFAKRNNLEIINLGTIKA